MADIKLAAKWMRDGKKVNRVAWENTGYVRASRADLVYDEKGREWALSIDDLLADDWQLAD